MTDSFISLLRSSRLKAVLVVSVFFSTELSLFSTFDLCGDEPWNTNRRFDEPELESMNEQIIFKVY